MIAKINGVNISYNIYGKATDYTLVLIHGYPLDQNMWSPQLELSTSIRIVTYDIRGFGNSENGKDPYSMQLFADDLVALIQHLKIENPIICGFSMGGYIALNAYSRFENIFKGIMLHDTQCNADTEEAKANRYDSIENIKKIGVSKYAIQFISKMISADSLNNNSTLVKWLEETINKNSTKQLSDILQSLAERGETCSLLEKISTPTLIIRGESDEIIPEDKAQFMLKNISNSKYIAISKAGHLSNMENKSDFNSAVSTFIKSF